ncbi:class I SAM-dependent methyltransferase [Rhizobium sp. WW_1]|jgi:hypothetical protein|uniref:class I SAM-dependent methyltransferase n=1 Tax=Rhizobium sp. WW_1 TaxID=1907375 RepID=UPI00068AF498|nr:class I SAM-dependent methyltransferase [Rhizobium sp. WW_1]RKD67795.1 O-methyltransferase [Rhizobium sp. WW_1]
MSDLPSIALLCIVTLSCLSILLFHLVTGVPPMPSSAAVITDVIDLLRQANLPPRPKIYELGSGWGSLAIALARAFPDAEIHGFELSPLPFLFARLRTRGIRNLSIHWGDFFRQDVSDADAITCYLMIRPMPKVGAFLDSMLRPGTAVVSLTFWFRDRRVDASRNGAGLRGAAALYYWPAEKT